MEIYTFVFTVFLLILSIGFLNPIKKRKDLDLDKTDPSNFDKIYGNKSLTKRFDKSYSNFSLDQKKEIMECQKYEGRNTNELLEEREQIKKDLKSSCGSHNIDYSKMSKVIDNKELLLYQDQCNIKDVIKKEIGLINFEDINDESDRYKFLKEYVNFENEKYGGLTFDFKEKTKGIVENEIKSTNKILSEGSTLCNLANEYGLNNEFVKKYVSAFKNEFEHVNFYGKKCLIEQVNQLDLSKMGTEITDKTHNLVSGVVKDAEAGLTFHSLKRKDEHQYEFLKMVASKDEFENIETNIIQQEVERVVKQDIMDAKKENGNYAKAKMLLSKLSSIDKNIPSSTEVQKVNESVKTELLNNSLLSTVIYNLTLDDITDSENDSFKLALEISKLSDNLTDTLEMQQEKIIDRTVEKYKKELISGKDSLIDFYNIVSGLDTIKNEDTDIDTQIKNKLIADTKINQALSSTIDKLTLSELKNIYEITKDFSYDKLPEGLKENFIEKSTELIYSEVLKNVENVQAEFKNITTNFEKVKFLLNDCLMNDSDVSSNVDNLTNYINKDTGEHIIVNNNDFIDNIIDKLSSQEIIDLNDESNSYLLSHNPLMASIHEDNNMPNKINLENKLKDKLEDALKEKTYDFIKKLSIDSNLNFVDPNNVDKLKDKLKKIENGSDEDLKNESKAFLRNYKRLILLN